MKNKTHQESVSILNPSEHRTSQVSREQRIQYFQKAWREGSLKINSSHLAQQLIDFERFIEPALPDSQKHHDAKN